LQSPVDRGPGSEAQTPQADARKVIRANLLQLIYRRQALPEAQPKVSSMPNCATWPASLFTRTPIRGLNLAHDFGQLCANFVPQKQASSTKCGCPPEHDYWLPGVADKLRHASKKKVRAGTASSHEGYSSKFLVPVKVDNRAREIGGSGGSLGPHVPFL